MLVQHKKHFLLVLTGLPYQVDFIECTYGIYHISRHGVFFIQIVLIVFFFISPQNICYGYSLEAPW